MLRPGGASFRGNVSAWWAGVVHDQVRGGNRARQMSPASGLNYGALIGPRARTITPDLSSFEKLLDSNGVDFNCMYLPAPPSLGR